MVFSLDASFELLQRTPGVLRAFTQNLSPCWTHHNEGGDTWTVFDVIGHLLHGERTDWMPRVFIIMSGNDNKTFPPFDRFAQFEESKGHTLEQLLDAFAAARAANLQQLAQLQLTEADLAKTGLHPTFGEVTLSQLLATWTVHDLDHLYQVARIMAFQYRDAVGPWTAFLRIARPVDR